VKPTKETMNIMLNAAYYEGKRAELSGQAMTLPADIPAFFDAVEAKATGLPEIFSDFEYGLNRYSAWGRHAHETGDEARLRKYIWIICQNLHQLERNLIEYSRNQGTIRGGKAPKRKPWAERLANGLVELGVQFPKAWATIPEDENNPLALDEDIGVYRSNNGGIVVAVDLVTGNELGEQSRSNFQKRYFSPAKQNPDTN